MSPVRARIQRLAAAAVALVPLVVMFQAGATDVEPTTFWKQLEEKTLYERIWERFRFYENESNDVMEAVSLIGRYNGQFYSVKADQGNADDWEMAVMRGPARSG